MLVTLLASVLSCVAPGNVNEAVGTGAATSREEATRASPYASLLGTPCGDWGELAVETSQTWGLTPATAHVASGGTSEARLTLEWAYYDSYYPDVRYTGSRTYSFLCLTGSVYLRATTTYGSASYHSLNFSARDVLYDPPVLVWPTGAGSGSAWSYDSVMHWREDHGQDWTYWSEAGSERAEGSFRVGSDRIAWTPLGPDHGLNLTSDARDPPLPNAEIVPGLGLLRFTGDDDLSGLLSFTWGVDADGDTFRPGEDCDDADATVHPHATEDIDGIDNDCDGLVDELVPVDADGDGYEATVDCDDANPAVHPGATESCATAADDDCDGDLDATDAIGCTPWHRDHDGDGFGSAGVVCRCEPYADYSTTDGADCDDFSVAVHPGASEVCDELDNDCDGEADVGIPSPGFADADGDGFGAVPVPPCEAASHVVASGGDCDDADIYRNPGAAEVCNGLDDDCDGRPDDGLAWTVAYVDADADGFGDPATKALLCGDPPIGWVVRPGDCDDADASVHPTAGDPRGDGVDENCNGRGT